MIANSDDNKLPRWFRSLQIASGIVSLSLSVLAIVLGYPTIALSTIITLLSVILLAIGVERVATGILLISSATSSASNLQRSGRTKGISITNIGLGILALIFAGIAFISPVTVSTIPLVLFSIAISVMFNGIGRIIQGALAKRQPTLFRIITISLGSLATAAAVVVGNSDVFGIAFPIHVLFGVLIIRGIAMIVLGSSGKLSVEHLLKVKR